MAVIFGLAVLALAVVGFVALVGVVSVRRGPACVSCHRKRVLMVHGDDGWVCQRCFPEFFESIQTSEDLEWSERPETR